MADRVLFLRGELRGGDRHAARDENRVVAETVGPARRRWSAAGQHARRGPLAPARQPVISGTGGRTRAATQTNWAPRAATSLSWPRTGPGWRGRRRARPPSGPRTPLACRAARPRRGRSRRRPRAGRYRRRSRGPSAARCRRTSGRFPATSGAPGKASSPASAVGETGRGKDAGELGDLVLIARREDHARGARTAGSATKGFCLQPGQLRAPGRGEVEQQVSIARPNGSRSAVPWISTKSPTPVQTTFMSVSAAESSS